MGVVEWWRPFGALGTQDFYCMCYVYNSGEPDWYESGERETTSVCVGTREGRSGDCGRRARSWRCSLSRQGGNDNDNPIRKINNKVQVYQVRSLDRPLFIVFAQNSEGIIVTSQTREQGMMECAVSSSLFSEYAIKKRVH